MTDWSFACPDWQDRIRAGTSLLPHLPALDKNRAIRAKAVFDHLCLPDVVGKPLLKEAAGDWFREIVGALHGSLIDGKRHIREPFVMVPKKNSKTSNGAALMLTSLLVNERPNAEFLLVAPTQAIAELAFRQVAGMIDSNETLSRRLHIQAHIKKVTDPKSGATLQVKSFDHRVLTGVKPAGVLMDELHVISESADADRVVGQLRGGLISQPEGFLCFITTQSERPPAGVFRAELQKARAIRDGRATGSMLPILYEFPEDIASTNAWRDPANWWMITPNRGRSIEIDRLIEEFEAAKQSSEEETRRWASQHLNIEIGLALRSDRWVGADYWERAADASLSLEDILARSEVVCVGIDGGGLDDLFGLAVLGRDAKTRQWLLWAHAWAHQSVLDRRKAEAPRLRDLEKGGDLTIIQDLGDDVQEIVEIVAGVDDLGKLHSVGLDPMGVGTVIDALAEKGIVQDEGGTGRVVGIPQGWRLTGAIKTMERKLADGTLRHCGQMLMNWAVGNAKVEPRGNAITITKQAAGSAKIDPLMAAFDAVALMEKNPEGQGLSVFDQLDDDDPQEDDNELRSDDIDLSILGDPSHPKWNEMRERWEAKNLIEEAEFS